MMSAALAGQLVHVANPYRAQIAVLAPGKAALAGVCGGTAEAGRPIPKLPIIARFGLCAQVSGDTLHAWADRIYGERNFHGLEGAVRRVITRRGQAIASLMGLSFEYGNPCKTVEFAVPTVAGLYAPVNAYHDDGQDISGYSYNDDDNARHSFGEDVEAGSRFTCEHCDCRIHEDEVCSDDNGYDYCSECFHTLFTICDNCNRYCDANTVSYVDRLRPSGQSTQWDVCDYCRRESFDYCDVCEAYYRTSLSACPNGCDAEDDAEGEDQEATVEAA